MKVISISGTPGTGKSYLAKILVEQLGFERIYIDDLIRQKGLCDEYDEKKQCQVVDLDKLIPVIIKLIKKSKKSLVIDSHLSHKIPKKYVSLCLITKTDLKVLDQRLKERGYLPKKIRENLDAEIFDVCLTEAEAAGHQIMIIDTSKKIDEEEFVEKIKDKLKLK